MTPRVRIPRDFFPKPLPQRAVTRFYKLLDSGTLRNRDASYAGPVAAQTVAQEFNVPRETLWRWIREYADQRDLKSA